MPSSRPDHRPPDGVPSPSPRGWWRAAALRGVNVALRGSTLLSKFLLIFVLAKLLAPAEVGLYGLLVASVSYALMGLGLDFYAFANRELIAARRPQWAALLRDQGVFYLLVYALLMPLCLVLFGIGVLPWHLALWFFPLLVVEHLAQEFNRLLVAMAEPLWASAVLFVRSGLWAVLVSVWLWHSPEARDLDHVFGAWLVGAAAACLLAFSRLRSLPTESLRQPIQWRWIRRGVVVALPFALSTLTLRLLNTADRYLIESFHGLEVLAAYALFAGIANALMSAVDASVFSFQGPKLVAAASAGDDARFASDMRHLGLQTTLVTVALTGAALLLAHPLVDWIGQPVYATHFAMLHWTLLGAALMTISMVPHLGLYARRNDRPIVYTHLASLPVFALAVAGFRPLLAENTVPAAVAVASLFILVSKALMYRQTARRP